MDLVQETSAVACNLLVTILQELFPFLSLRKAAEALLIKSNLWGLFLY